MRCIQFFVVGFLFWTLESWPDRAAHAISHRELFTPYAGVFNDHLGWIVSGGLDVSGDGWPDAVVGAPYDTLGGRAYIYFGGPAADTLADLTLVAQAKGDEFGISVALVGDVNGDGQGDFAVGAPQNPNVNTGKVYVYFGGSLLNAVADRVLLGTTVGELFGFSIGATDMNGDGAADIVVGAYGYKTPGMIQGHAGRAYLFFGGASADNVADLTFTDALEGDSFGCSVAGSGYVNNDVYQDVIIGARENDGGGVNAGRAYLYFGGAAPNAVADRMFTGLAAGDELGLSVAGAGDINNDGFDDLVVGAPFQSSAGLRSGRAYIYYGGSAMDVNADIVLNGAAAGDFFGVSVATAGDVNNDQYSDVIVGGMESAGPTHEGYSKIYLGGALPDNVADIVLDGSQLGGEFGHSVASLGDWDGDGFEDVITGEPGSSSGNRGHAHVILIYPYQVISPNGGEHWVRGGAATVVWRGHDVAELDLSLNNGSTWATLATSVGGSETNQRLVSVPMSSTNQARVRLRYTGQAASSSNSDQSNANFSIIASTSITGDTSMEPVVLAPLPNPVSAGNRIGFKVRVAETTEVTLTLFDLNGRRMASRHPEPLAGRVDHHVVWELKNIPPGMYVVRAETPGGLLGSTKITVLP